MLGDDEVAATNQFIRKKGIKPPPNEVSIRKRHNRDISARSYNVVRATRVMPMQRLGKTASDEGGLC